MTALYLVRHGAFIFKKTPPFDYGLSDLGIEQSQRLRDRLASGEFKPDVLISSTSPRAVQTAGILAEALNLEVEHEQDVEEWRNFNEQSIENDLGAALRAVPYRHRTFYLPAPGCETYAEFIYRACTTLNRLIGQHTGKTIMLVCHGGIVEAAFHLFFGFSPFQPNPATMLLDPAYTSLTHWRSLDSKNQEWMLCEYNDKSHLI